MATLSFREKKTIEDFLDMGSGYVCNFSDRTFHDFIGSIVEIDINDPKYSVSGTSKANRLRTFIRLEPDFTVGTVFKELYLYRLDELNRRNVEVDNDLARSFQLIVERLLSGGIIEHIDAIQATNDDKDFNQLAKLIKESIQKNEPESALDRLHVFLIKFLKELCKSHEVTFVNEETVNALYGKYIKAIRSKRFIESIMAEKIVQFSFQIIEAFNDVRNNKSFAHDNAVLNYDESILIFSSVTSMVKFIQSLEAKHKNTAVSQARPDWGSFNDL